jgi:hypothetical protein
VAISTWVQPAALGGTMMFEFSPHKASDVTTRKLRGAFWERVNEFMTEFSRGGFRQEGEMITPVKPIAFEVGGVIFSTITPTRVDPTN